jgi:arylsulfatase A-like enzyme
MYDKPTGTGHGTPWSYDALVPLVFWGKGIPAERFETPASPMDIAPTLGRLLGINYPAADGGALRNEIFK